jgi:hypothetical protein
MKISRTDSIVRAALTRRAIVLSKYVYFTYKNLSRSAIASAFAPEPDIVPKPQLIRSSAIRWTPVRLFGEFGEHSRVILAEGAKALT